jgi:hypothetical protein
MLAQLFQEQSVPCHSINTSILYCGPSDADELETAEAVEVEKRKQTATQWFGLNGPLLEIVADPDAYLRSVTDLVTGADSVARQAAQLPFEQIPFSLSYKCDGCLYNEYCMKWCAEHDDLSLLPHLSGVEKNALQRGGIQSVLDMATLKEFVPLPPGARGKPTELAPAKGRENVVRRLAATWPVGPRLDELIHRGRSFRYGIYKDDLQALTWIPGKGSSSLPVCTPELNANLIRVYLDAQHDYLNDRVYLLSALAVACENGAPDPKRRRSIVLMTDKPPTTAQQERDLFVEWSSQLARAVIDLAAPGELKDGHNTAPLHLIFFNRFEQRLLLEGLARNFPPILQHTPPLYDFLTQLAAFDTPIATFLDEEIRSFKNFPMTCQSLQSLATYLKFDWKQPKNFRELFKARLFDYLGKLEIGGESEWFTRRSRFNSQVPLEYAYAAWNELPPLIQGKADAFSDFRPITVALLKEFQARRLEALEHVANDFDGNPLTRKTPFVLPNLAFFEDKAHDMAHALREFVIIERHVDLGGWKTTRHAPPERRVLMGECLIVQYREEDQEPAVAEAIRDHQVRQRKRAEYTAEFQAAHPGSPVKLTKEQNKACRWSPEGLVVRLRLEAANLDCSLHEALGLSNLRRGDRLVLCPRWTVDERLPPAQ